MKRAAGFAKEGPYERLRRRKTDHAETEKLGGAKDALHGPRDRRRRARISGAAAQSIISALYAAPSPKASDKTRQAQAAMGKPAKMTKAAIEAHLQDRARQSAWVFDRRKGDQPRRVDAEDAIILD